MHLIDAVIKHDESIEMNDKEEVMEETVDKSTPPPQAKVEEEEEPVETETATSEESPNETSEEIEKQSESEHSAEAETPQPEESETKTEPIKEDEKEGEGITQEDDDTKDTIKEEGESEEEKALAIKRAEAKAIADATASADASYTPSATLLSDPSPHPLLKSVDGPSLSKYSQKPAVFIARSVPIPLRGKLDVPIHVTNAGSIVEYTIESENYDISFGIIAEREEGITVVAENSRIDTHLEAVTGKFLVGTVPCALIFTFDNEYSWFREKRITYCITVTPPSTENIIAGRRRRAKSALGVVLEDKIAMEKRLEPVSVKRNGIVQEVERLELELTELKKTLGVVEKEEDWLKTKVELRTVQERSLQKRLDEGWEDEATQDEEEEKPKEEEVSVDEENRAEV